MSPFYALMTGMWPSPRRSLVRCRWRASMEAIASTEAKEHTHRGHWKLHKMLNGRCSAQDDGQARSEEDGREMEPRS